MNTSRKPIIMIGGLNVSPNAVIESLDRKIPYLLVGCHEIDSDRNNNPKKIYDAFERVLHYVNKLKEREV